MKKTCSIVILTLLCFALKAQSVPFIVRNTDPRSLAMGIVGTENPAAANVFSGNKMDFSASYGIQDTDCFQCGLAGFNASLNSGNLSFGLDGRYNMDEEYEMFSGVAQSLGYFKPSEMSLAASFAYAFMAGFSLGLRASYISSKLSPEASGTSVGFDISAAYSKDRFCAVLALRNLGPEIKYGDYGYALPSLAALGISCGGESFRLRFEAGCFFSGSAMAGAGAEYTFARIVSLRAGFHYGDDGIIPMFSSVGLGVKFAGARLDCTYLPSVGSLSFGLGYSF